MAQIYQQLVPVLIGEDALDDMAKRIVDEGKKRVFIVTDKGVSASGGAKKVVSALNKVGITDIKVFDDMIPDPPDTFVEEVASVEASWGPDLIIGLGGGSALDTAKASGVCMDNGKPIRDYFAENSAKPFTVKTPVYVIPTASGTGSECTPMCVLHDMTTDQKNTLLRPADLAILDPWLTVTCPKGVTVNSALDALSHAIEAVTSVAPNPKDMLLGYHAIELIRDNLEICIDDPANIEARGNLQFAANIAGIAFADMSVHVGHLFSHELGLRYHLNHGLCCALATPVTIEFVAEHKPAEIRRIGKALHVDVPEGISNVETAQIVADELRFWMKKLGVKSLKELDIPRDEMIGMAAAAVDHGWFHVMCPGDVSAEQMAQFCADVYDRYQ